MWLSCLSRFFGCFLSGFLLLCCLCSVAVAADCVFEKGPTSQVTKIIGPTSVELETGQIVRLVGLYGLRRPKTGAAPGLDYEKSVSELGSLLLHKQVELAFGGRKEDRYGRALAHVYLMRDGERLWVQRLLVERGLVRVASFADNPICVDRLLTYEALARKGQRGFWRMRSGFRFNIYDALKPKAIKRRLHSFQLVEGTVLNVADVRGWVFLNFEEDWRSDFTIAIAKKDRKRFGGASFDFQKYAGKQLRVRGWIERWNGPVIKVTHPEQIEILEPDEASTTDMGSANKKSAETVQFQRIN